MRIENLVNENLKPSLKRAILSLKKLNSVSNGGLALIQKNTEIANNGKRERE
jgi:hypothetical protein